MSCSLDLALVLGCVDSLLSQGLHLLGLLCWEGGEKISPCSLMRLHCSHWVDKGERQVRQVTYCKRSTSTRMYFSFLLSTYKVSFFFFLESCLPSRSATGKLAKPLSSNLGIISLFLSSLPSPNQATRSTIGLRQQTTARFFLHVVNEDVDALLDEGYRKYNTRILKKFILVTLCKLQCCYRVQHQRLFGGRVEGGLTRGFLLTEERPTWLGHPVLPDQTSAPTGRLSEVGGCFYKRRGNMVV